MGCACTNERVLLLILTEIKVPEPVIQPVIVCIAPGIIFAALLELYLYTVIQSTEAIPAPTLTTTEQRTPFPTATLTSSNRSTTIEQAKPSLTATPSFDNETGM